MDQARHGTLHHVEMWVPNLDRATATWGWLLGELGYDIFQDWPGGRSWRSGSTYIVFEQSPARTAIRHDRCRPGLNHLAFHVKSREKADSLAAAATAHGWRLMFADQHPYAGGKGHYAAYLENVDGYEAELVAPDEDQLAGPAAAEPVSTAPVSTAPVGTGPVSTGPTSTESASTEAGADDAAGAGEASAEGGGAPAASGAPPPS